MSNERKLILEKVNMLINKRKVELLKRFPSIHEVDDDYNKIHLDTNEFQEITLENTHLVTTNNS